MEHWLYAYLLPIPAPWPATTSFQSPQTNGFLNLCPSMFFWEKKKKAIPFSKTIWAHDATGTIAFNQFLQHDGVFEPQPETYAIQ